MTELTLEMAIYPHLLMSGPVEFIATPRPHSRTHRVDDPELAANLRAEVDRLAADMVGRGVIPEAPRAYEIIVMEEG
jgi:hypothetical protein